MKYLLILVATALLLAGCMTVPPTPPNTPGEGSRAEEFPPEEERAPLSSEHFAELVAEPDQITCYLQGEPATPTLEQAAELHRLLKAAMSDISGEYGIYYEPGDIDVIRAVGVLVEYRYLAPVRAEWRHSEDYTVYYEYDTVTFIISAAGSSLEHTVLVGAPTPTPAGDLTVPDELTALLDSLLQIKI